MKVKIFKEYTPNWLEDNINSWLEKNKYIQLIDIKYSAFLNDRGRDKISCYTAMVIYKELASFEDVEINEEDLPFGEGGVN